MYFLGFSIRIESVKSKFEFMFLEQKSLTLSWRRPLLYRNQSINLQSKSMDWFVYDNDLRNEIINTRTHGTMLTRIRIVKTGARMSVIYPFFVDVFGHGVF